MFQKQPGGMHFAFDNGITLSIAFFREADAFASVVAFETETDKDVTIPGHPAGVVEFVLADEVGAMMTAVAALPDPRTTRFVKDAVAEGERLVREGRDL